MSNAQWRSSELYVAILRRCLLLQLQNNCGTLGIVALGIVKPYLIFCYCVSHLMAQNDSPSSRTQAFPIKKGHTSGTKLSIKIFDDCGTRRGSLHRLVRRC